MRGLVHGRKAALSFCIEFLRERLKIQRAKRSDYFCPADQSGELPTLVSGLVASSFLDFFSFFASFLTATTNLLGEGSTPKRCPACMLYANGAPKRKRWARVAKPSILKWMAGTGGFAGEAAEGEVLKFQHYDRLVEILPDAQRDVSRPKKTVRDARTAPLAL